MGGSLAQLSVVTWVKSQPFNTKTNINDGNVNAIDARPLLIRFY